MKWEKLGVSFIHVHSSGVSCRVREEEILARETDFRVNCPFNRTQLLSGFMCSFMQ